MLIHFEWGGALGIKNIVHPMLWACMSALTCLEFFIFSLDWGRERERVHSLCWCCCFFVLFSQIALSSFINGEHCQRCTLLSKQGVWMINTYNIHQYIYRCVRVIRFRKRERRIFLYSQLNLFRVIWSWIFFVLLLRFIFIPQYRVAWFIQHTSWTDVCE